MLSELDHAYYERNKLVRFLASIYPSGVAKTNIPDWEPEWHNCVYIDTPAGQLSWHYHDREAHLFQSLPPYTKEWDGHSTQEKYLRLERLTFDGNPMSTEPEFVQAIREAVKALEEWNAAEPLPPAERELYLDLSAALGDYDARQAAKDK